MFAYPDLKQFQKSVFETVSNLKTIATIDSTVVIFGQNALFVALAKPIHIGN